MTCVKVGGRCWDGERGWRLTGCRTSLTIHRRFVGGDGRRDEEQLKLRWS